MGHHHGDARGNLDLILGLYNMAEQPGKGREAGTQCLHAKAVRFCRLAAGAALQCEALCLKDRQKCTWTLLARSLAKGTLSLFVAGQGVRGG